MASKSNFLDKVLGRLPRLDKEGLQSVVERLAREGTNDEQRQQSDHRSGDDRVCDVPMILQVRERAAETSDPIEVGRVRRDQEDRCSVRRKAIQPDAAHRQRRQRVSQVVQPGLLVRCHRVTRY